MVSVRLDRTLYDHAAVDHGTRAFAEWLAIRPGPQSPEHLLIELVAHGATAVDEFLNFVLAASIDVRLRP